MGYTTDFIGHIDVTPPINQSEQAYLQAFASSRRYAREGGPYVVPGNPSADNERPANLPTKIYNTVADQQPGLWCDWVPCWDGCCLAYNGNEKFYGATRWLTYLIEHLLRPGAYAQASGLPYFEDFSFDHRLDGVIAGCRRDNKEMFLIWVEHNEVSEEILRPADPRFLDYPPLAYEAEIDRWESKRKLERRKRRVS